MKKNLFLLPVAVLLVFSSCFLIADNGGNDGENSQLWLIGSVNSNSLKNPIPFAAQGNGVYVWQGNLPAGQLRFNGDPEPSYSGIWYGPQTNGEIPPNGVSISMFSSNYTWTIDIPANYTITANVPAMRVTFRNNSGGSEPVEPVGPHPKGIYGNYYEIFVGSFYDSNGDGVGDIRGIIQKLNYLNDGNPDSAVSLNIDGIWLMPINPSTSYHKYDVRNYTAIDSSYGTMNDFEDLISECNKRGIRVIIDLVVNHTSTGHTWFQNARSGNAVYQAYYNISGVKVNNYWYQLPGSNPPKYYEAVFWDQMPDLNYDNPAVRAEMEKIIDFWLDKGVSGFRLDAVKHIYEIHGTGNNKSSDHNKNVEWLRWFTNYCRSKKDDVYIVAEVWEWGIDLNKSYYSSGVPSNFNFYAAQNRIPTYAKSAVPASDFASYVVNWNTEIKKGSSSAIDAPFISNHDMSRIASVIGNNSTQQKMAASMLLFSPGNPFIYYGDEIGTTGTLPNDQNARGPMRWSRSNRIGETKGPGGNSQAYWDASSVSEQLGDSGSVLRFYIDTMNLKNRYPQIHWGTPSLLSTSQGNSISAYKISSGRADEKDLAVVHNLSNSSQTVTITGAAALGGTLSAAGASAAKPVLSGNTLTMPAFTTAIIEY